MGRALTLRDPIRQGLFVSSLLAYAYFHQGGDWNQNSRWDLTRSLVIDGTSRIDRYQQNTGDKARLNGAYYCDKAPGLSWLAVPTFAFAYVASGAHETTDTFVQAAAYLSTVMVVGISSALAVCALDVVLASLGLSMFARLVLCLAYAFGTLAFPYSTMFYGHQPTASLLVCSFALAMRVRWAQSTPHPAVAVLVGGLLGASIAVDYSALLGVLPVGAYAAVALRVTRLRWLLIAALGVPLIALATYHWLNFGAPTALPYAFSTQTHRHQGFFMGLGAPNVAVVGRLLVGSYRGLLFSSPWIALAVVGGVRLSKSPFRLEACLCACVFVLFLWLNSSLVDWEGGWTFGPRYLLPTLPFLTVLTGGVFVFQQRTVRGVLVWALAASALVSCLLMCIATSVEPAVPYPLMHPNPFADYLIPHFIRGELALNTQGFQDYLPKGTTRRAFNWGTLLGLRGLWSLVPLASMLALTALVTSRRWARTRAESRVDTVS